MLALPVLAAPAPAPVPLPAPMTAPGDIYPRGPREEQLCAIASRPDWLYLVDLAALDTLSIWYGSKGTVKYSDSMPVRYASPIAIGLTWGATVSGAWFALPKCSPSWVGEAPPEGGVRETWPLALAFALLGGATAPLVNGIAVGYPLPTSWSTDERVAHIIGGAVAGFVGALIPYYLIPPRTWAAARELERLRVDIAPSPQGTSAYIRYALTF